MKFLQTHAIALHNWLMLGSLALSSVIDSSVGLNDSIGSCTRSDATQGVGRTERKLKSISSYNREDT